MQRLFLFMSAVALTGCAAQSEKDLLEGSTRVFNSQYRQVLNNIAEFQKYPDTLPRHIFLLRGKLEADGDVGIGVEEFPVSFEQTRSLHWEICTLGDPDDIARVRLLYQWVVGRLSFENLRAKWEAHEAATGRTKVALPVTKDTATDWYTDEKAKSVVDIHGQFAGKKIWFRDISGAAEFAIAVLRAAPNSRRESGRARGE